MEDAEEFKKLEKFFLLFSNEVNCMACARTKHISALSVCLSVMQEGIVYIYDIGT